MFSHFLITWRLGLRSKNFQAFLVIGLLGMGIALLAAQFTGRQPTIVAVDVGLSFIRLVGILLVLFWAQELLAKDLDRKVLHVVLPYPLPRSAYLLGRFLGLAVLLAGALAVFGLLLWGVAEVSRLGVSRPTPVDPGLALILVLLYLWLALLPIASFTWLISTLATTSLLPFFLGLAFAWAGYMLRPALEYLQAGEGAAKELQSDLQPALESLLWLLPDLSRLDIRPALLYGKWPSPEILGGAPLNALAYTLLFLGLSVVVFKRREFA